MYPEQFLVEQDSADYSSPLQPSTSTETSFTSKPDNSLTTGQKAAIISFVSATALVIIILLLKQCGEWIGYRWAIRRHKNHIVDMNNALSGISAADRARVINNLQNQRSNPYYGNNYHAFGPDPPPAYNEALHLETLDFGNENASDMDHPPPNYWSCASIDPPPNEGTITGS